MADSHADRITSLSQNRGEEENGYGRAPYDDSNRKPRYYEGVFTNDRTISTNGDVITPVSLRPALSRGLLNLPRYVPKYTINSRLHANDTNESLSNGRKRDAYKRTYGGYDEEGIPYFRDDPVYTRRDDYCNNQEQKKESTPTRARKRNNSRNCCKECCRCTCTSSRCCRKCNCTPKASKVICVLVAIALVAGALAALALGLYFGYYEQLGDPNAMTADFTIQTMKFQSNLSDPSNPQTMVLGDSLCEAFQNVLRDIDDLASDVSYCTAVSFTNGSINAIFNIGVRHKRDAYMNSANAFILVVQRRLETDFQLAPSSGEFFNAISRALSAHNVSFTIRLNALTSGHASTLSTTPASTGDRTTTLNITKHTTTLATNTMRSSKQAINTSTNDTGVIQSSNDASCNGTSNSSTSDTALPSGNTTKNGNVCGNKNTTVSTVASLSSLLGGKNTSPGNRISMSTAVPASSPLSFTFWTTTGSRSSSRSTANLKTSPLKVLSSITAVQEHRTSGKRDPTANSVSTSASPGSRTV